MFALLALIGRALHKLLFKVYPPITTRAQGWLDGELGKPREYTNDFIEDDD